MMKLRALLLSALPMLAPPAWADDAAPHTPGALSGLHFPPLPAGMTEWAGVCLELAQAAPGSCEYSFGVLADTHGAPRILYAARSEGRDASGKPRWLVLDSVDISALPAGYRMTLWQCSRDDVADATIVAAVHEDATSPWFRQMLWAKRLSLEQGRFVDIPLRGLRCANDIGED